MRKTHWSAVFSICGIALWLFACESSPQKKPLSSGEISTSYLQLGYKYKTLDYDSALLFFRKAKAELDTISIAQQDSLFWERYVSSHIELSKGLAMQANFEGAHAILDTLIPDGKKKGLLPDLAEARLWLRKSTLYLEQQAWTREEKWLDESKKWLEKNIEKDGPFPSSYMVVQQLALGRYNGVVGKDSLGRVYFDEAIQGSIALGDSVLLMEALLGMSKVSWGLKESCLKRILAMNEDVVYDAHLLATACIDYATNRRIFRDNKKTFIEYTKKGYDVYKKVFSSDSLAYSYFPRIYKILGVAFEEEGDYHKAIHYANRSIELLEKLGKQASGEYINLAIAYLKVAPDKTIKILKDIYPGFRYGRKITALVNLGAAYQEIGEFDRAIEIHKETLTLKRAAENLPKNMLDKVISNSYLNIGTTYGKAGNYKKAIDYLEKAKVLKLRIKETDGFSIANTYFELGNAYFGQKNFEAALEQFQLAINANVPSCSKQDIYDSVSLDSVRHSSLDLLYPLSFKAHSHGLIFKETKERKEMEAATSFFKVTSKLIDEVRQEIISNEAKQRFMSIGRATYDKAINHAMLAYEVTDSMGYLNEAFQYVEKSKYLLLSEALATSKAKFSTIPDSLLQKEQVLKKAISEMETAVFDLGQGKQNAVAIAKIDAHKKNIFETEEALEGLNDEYKSNYPNYYQIKNHTLVSLDEVKTFQKEKPETAILQYSLSEGYLNVFGFYQEEVYTHRQLLDTSFFNDISLLREMLKDSPYSMCSAEWKEEFREFCRVARSLYQILLEPILAQIPAEKITIIPDRELGYIPFQVLLSEEPKVDLAKSCYYHLLPFLFKEKLISYEYSAGLLVDEKQNTNKVTFDYLGFAPVYKTDEKIEPNKSLKEGVAGKLKALEYNTKEIEETADLFNGRKFIGETAIEKNFKEYADEAKILHLSMHGEVHDKNPLYSQLIFTDVPGKEDGRLYAHELYSLQLNADLAVLSACNTGAGELKRGEGIMSIARAFKYAGCPSIVMSLWPADDKSSKDIIVSFFKNMKEEMPKNEALELARRHYFETIERDELAHPFYWSTFVLIGDDTPVELLGDSTKYLYWFVAFILLSIMLAWYFRYIGRR